MTSSTTTDIAGPTRTCVACRQRRPANQLVRFVARDGVVVPDLRRVHNGRGVHLCPERTCLERAVKRSAFGRALRTQVRVEQTQLCQDLGEAFANEVQRVTAGRRTQRANHNRSPWLAKGREEFTLNIPGAMNRGPANGRETSSTADGARRRSGSHE